MRADPRFKPLPLEAVDAAHRRQGHRCHQGRCGPRKGSGLKEAKERVDDAHRRRTRCCACRSKPSSARRAASSFSGSSSSISSITAGRHLLVFLSRSRLMLLIGMFDSPFVRRVAITMKLLEMPFEHGNWSVGKDFDRIRELQPARPRADAGHRRRRTAHGVGRDPRLPR